MKKITLLLIAIITLCFSFSAKAQCNYTLEMNDSYGDGWNGGTMDVLVDGFVVIDEATFATGAQATLTFPVNDGEDVTTMHSLDGFYAGEMSYRILDAFGVEVGTGNPTADITTGTITVACPACSVPVATYSTVSNCPVDTDFTIEVVIADIGLASSVTISDNQGTAASGGLTAGTYSYGAYANATPVVITITNDDDGTCTTTSASLTFANGACPPANDDFANASPIVCGGNYTGTTTTASLDENDAPDGFSSLLDAPNVWYTYDGATEGAGDVTLNLCGSDYDTAVMIYTGTSGNLTLVGGNDDNGAACGQCCQSLATFTADDSTLYYITIEGYLGSTGDFDLNVSCVAAAPAPANDLCGDAEALTLTVTANGTTVGATQTGTQEPPTCDQFGVIADVWYFVDLTFVSNTLSVITTITDTSDQANVAVYSSTANSATCLADQASSVGCSDANGGETLVVNGLAAGTYYIRVWSDGNAPAPPTDGRVEGGFTITLDATLSVDSIGNENAFTYFPNPVRNELTLNSQKDIQNVAVFNMLGQEVLRTSPNSPDSVINMETLSQGAYFVQVTIGNVTETLRIIKQ